MHLTLVTYFFFWISADEAKAPQSDIINIKYGISGNRTIGAHLPVTAKEPVAEDANNLVFKSILVLQRPVLDPCMSVGFLPLPSDCLRVGQLVTMKWRVERLKDFEENEVSQHNVSYEVIPFSMVANSLLLS